MFTEFDKRMKRLEKSFTDIKLLPKCPVVIRLDGKAFHTYTKQFKDKTAPDPFSEVLHSAFVESCIELAKNVAGCQAIYTQSDEVSVWLSDEGKSDQSQGWFDFELQKLISISSSILTANFNRIVPSDKLAYFDARAFSIPNKIELNNYFIWRQQDAVRNSISMIAQHNFSHKSLMGMSSSQMQERLFQEKQINWNYIDAWKKRGTTIVKKKYLTNTEYVDNKTKEHKIAENVVRHKWVKIFPTFTQQAIFDIIKEDTPVQQKV